tara:strand:- start:4352 stop:4561 length:210 start_codon:yes stop_codon:yes gene_type:complete
MKNNEIKTVSIVPESNDMKIALNVAYELFEKDTKIDRNEYFQCLQIVKLTIKEMEKQKLVNYKGPINQA